MATIKPRITVTLSERQHEVFKSISASSGQSMSKVVMEVLDASMPVFERMAVTFQALKRAKDKEREKMVGLMDDAQSALEPLAQLALDQLDMFFGNIEASVRPAHVGGKRSAPPTGKGRIGSEAPSTNRGVTTPRGKGQKPIIASKLQGKKPSKVFLKVKGK